MNMKLSLLALALALAPSAFALVGSLGPKVIVTGAAGRVGKLVFSRLTDSPKFEAVGLVRTEKSAKKLMKEVECGIDHVVVVDVTELNHDEERTVPQGLAGAESMIICTSAVPYISKMSAIKVIMKIPTNVILGKKAVNPRDFEFKYRPGQYPEKVDYEGQKKQIDLAVKLGIEHVVLVSSMGGTDPSNYLNTMGKDKDGNGHGDVLLWKRKAEKYLTKSGLSYTIIHPGRLLDTASGEKELILDVDDKLSSKNEKRYTGISRGDVADLCVAALTVGKGRNVSFDCTSRDVVSGKKIQSADEALAELLRTGRTTDYSL